MVLNVQGVLNVDPLTKKWLPKDQNRNGFIDVCKYLSPKNKLAVSAD
jgi:hypothetical protein